MLLFLKFKSQSTVLVIGLTVFFIDGLQYLMIPWGFGVLGFWGFVKKF